MNNEDNVPRSPGTATIGRRSYDELPPVPGTDEHHAWLEWGTDDQLGTINRLSPACTRTAASLVQSGRVVSLSLPLDQPAPGLFPNRTPHGREEERTNIGREDRLTHFDLQFSSQWDGLRHIRHRTAGYYGGRTDDQLDAGALGIDNLARHGIVGRGVLLDLPNHYAATNRQYSPNTRISLGPDEIDEILDRQGTPLQDGDILLIHTGWIDWYLTLTDIDRAGLVGSVHAEAGGLHCPGLAADTNMARWLWNSGLAAVAADNPTVEALPVRREEGFLHRRVLPLLGMPFGELWLLSELAHHCREARRFDFMLTSAPLHVTDGVASPANALAIL